MRLNVNFITDEKRFLFGVETTNLVMFVAGSLFEHYSPISFLPNLKKNELLKNIAKTWPRLPPHWLLPLIQATAARTEIQPFKHILPVLHPICAVRMYNSVLIKW